jgi:hypothetical protein
MRNQRIYSIFQYVFLLALAVSAVASDFPRSEERARRVHEPETYNPAIVLAVKYGDATGQLGFVAGGSDQRPLGPLSFAVEADGSSIAILDSVKQRVATFDRYGALHSIIADVHGTDVAFMDNGIGVLDTATATLVIHSGGRSREIGVSTEQSKLSVDAATGVVSFRERRVSTTSLNADALSPGTEVLRVDDHGGEIRTVSGSTIPVRAAKTFGSIDLVGSDKRGNIFVAVEQLLPGPVIDVIKEVRKYSPSGELRAVIPIDIDYAVHPRREFVLDGEGVLYHLRPLADAVVIERWEVQP